MVSKKLTVTNPLGFHRRESSLFVSEVSKYDCSVTIHGNDKEIDGKSVLLLIAAGLKCGTEIEVVCDGPEEKEALEAGVKLIESEFGTK